MDERSANALVFTGHDYIPVINFQEVNVIVEFLKRPPCCNCRAPLKPGFSWALVMDYGRSQQ